MACTRALRGVFWMDAKDQNHVRKENEGAEIRFEENNVNEWSWVIEQNTQAAELKEDSSQA